MLISPKHKFIFFKSMKCAGSSVEFSLLKNCTDDALCTGGIPEEDEVGFVERNNSFIEGEFLIQRFHAHTWPDLFFSEIANPSFYDDYKKITIVRNPWDTLVSWYWWGLSHKGPQNSWLAIHADDDPAIVQDKFKTFLNVKSQHDSIRIKDEIVKTSPLFFLAEYNQKFLHQSIDVYLRFESLSEDHERLCNDLQIPVTERERFKSTQRKLPWHYSLYYNDSTRRQVEDQFPELIKKFNYTFESPDAD